jgi:hypothetical protein
MGSRLTYPWQGRVPDPHWVMGHVVGAVRRNHLSFVQAAYDRGPAVNHRDVSDAGAYFATGDYEYDSAHDATTGSTSTARTEDHVQPQTSHPETQADGDEGDYGYDLAHDMRPR